MNKTGTSSLKRTLIEFGLTTPNQRNQEITLYNLLNSGKFSEIKTYLDGWDFFQDLPFSMGSFFAQLDCMYPDAKFILTVRNTEDWWNSFASSHSEMWRHYIDRKILLSDMTRRLMLKGKYLMPGYEVRTHRRYWLSNIKENRVFFDWSKLYNKETYCNIYEARNQMIIQNFATRRDKLLIIDLSKEPSTERLLKFLGIPDFEPKPFIRTNVTFNKQGK